MSKISEEFKSIQIKKNMPEIRSGDTVKVFVKIAGDKKETKIQVFEGLVIARKHGKGISSTITVRKIVSGIGVEKIFPVHSPVIEKIEIVKRGKVRRAKLYYIREAKGRKARLKRKEFSPELMTEEEEKAEAKAEKKQETKEDEDKPTIKESALEENVEPSKEEEQEIKEEDKPQPEGIEK